MVCPYIFDAPGVWVCWVYRGNIYDETSNNIQGHRVHLPCTLFGDRDDEEEPRLLYVGPTRARQRLIFSHASHRFM